MKRRIFLIGNTHFDPVWTWKWEEAMSSIHSTFRSVLNIMDENGDIFYSFATPPVFEWIKKTDPKMFEEIKNRVSEGRWELCEGWWVQPDCFSGCGESYARQSLYGQRYLKENFNKYSRSVFNVDSFGHNGQIPQILKKSHIDFYCMCRPEKWFLKIDSPFFNWASPDGSVVKAFRVGQFSEIYNKEMEKNVDLAEKNMENADCDEMMIFGVTNHGGAPTRKAIADARALSAKKDYAIRFSTVEGYFESQGDARVTVRSELLTRNFGPYVNGRRIKMLNRIAEYAVLNAEKSAVIAERLLGRQYESETLKKCWQDILFNHFHDILGGACMKEAYFDTRNQLGRAIFTSNELMYLNLQAVAKRIHTPGKNTVNPWNLLVWNLNETNYDGYLEGELQWLHEFPAYKGGITLEDERGERYGCQIILEKSVIPGFRSRVLFKAKIPALGYKTFRVVQEGEAKKERVHSLSVDTGVLAVEFDENTGLIKEARSEKFNKRWVDFFKPQCFEDEADSECFNTNTYGKAKECFSPVGIETTEQGEYRTIIKCEYKYRKSFLNLYYIFYKDTDYFDVKYTVSWNEEHTVLKFVSKTGYDKLIVATPFGAEKREDSASDLPMGEWVDLYDEYSGICFISNGSFAYSKADDTIGLSILRSCIYADMRLDENPLPPEDYPYMEQGEHEGSLRILFHNGNYWRGAVFNEAKAFNNPPIVICEPNHAGDYPAENSFVSVKGNGVMLTALKKAEDGNGNIVRLSEIGGVKQTAILQYFGKEYEIAVSPYEIKTLRINENTVCEETITEDEKECIV